jgi:hypothetical protein
MNFVKIDNILSEHILSRETESSKSISSTSQTSGLSTVSTTTDTSSSSSNLYSDQPSSRRSITTTQTPSTDVEIYSNNSENVLLILRFFYNTLINIIDKIETNKLTIVYGDNSYDIYISRDNINNLIILLSIYQIFADNQISNRCVFSSDIDLYGIIDVLPGETCTIESAKNMGIYDKYKYFNNNVSKDDIIEIDTLLNNKRDSNKKYSLCSIKNNVVYQNCAITTNNPWKTLSNDNEYCKLPSDIVLPNDLSYVKDKKDIIKKPEKIPKYKSKTEFCQERWYDWFTIPDYHLGNKYLLYEDKEKKNKSVCFKPCDIGKILIVKNGDTSKIENYQCILREKYNYPYFSTTFYYLPISLILLLGITKKNILKINNRILKEKKFNLEEILKNITIDDELYKELIWNEEKPEEELSGTLKNLYENMKKDIRYAIDNLFKRPFDATNIIPPTTDVRKISDSLMTKERLEDAYMIASELHKIINDPSKFKKYKEELADISGYDITHPKFFKQLLILKTACNVAFDNTHEYSKDFILYNLNTNSTAKSPIKFDITPIEPILAISNNPSENTVINNNDKENQKIYLQQEKEKLKADLEAKEQSIAKVEVRTHKIDISDITPKSYDDKLIYEYNNKKYEINSIRFVYLLFVIFIIIIMVSITLIAITLLLWTPIIEMINSTILATYFLVYYISDLFKGRYQPVTYDKKFLQKQIDFIINKIAYDMTERLQGYTKENNDEQSNNMNTDNTA